jgi:squalene synthase HpnC
VGVDHYENFPVASLLCPRRLRPAVAAIYRFARTADDIADEGDATAEKRLADLAEYRADLQAVCAGQRPSPRWYPVFQALRQAVVGHALPAAPFTDLLSAFEQDVVKHAYADRTELLDYCRRSANPVGRLLLHLYGVRGGQALQQADAICTALQLANFWQDLGVDIGRGRLYIPMADCRRHRVDPAELRRGRVEAGTRALIAEMVFWTRELMLRGAPLARSIPGSAGWELRLVVQGGLRILEKIERGGFEVLERRPALRWYDVPLLGWRALWMKSTVDPGVRKVA